MKADRSLAGRLVCGNCGQPLGAKGVTRRRSGAGRRRSRWIWIWPVAAVLGLSALLASREQRREVQPQPQSQPLSQQAPVSSLLSGLI